MTTTKTLLAVATLAAVGLFGTGGTASAQSLYGEKAIPAYQQRRVDKLVKEGQDLQAKGQYDDALDRYEAALKLDPKNKTALVESAWCYNDLGEYDDAKEAAEEAVAADPVRSKAWRELGYADWKLGDPKGAKANLQVAIDLNKYNTPAYTHLIAVLEELGEFRAAKKVQRQKDAIELDMLLDAKLSGRTDD
jgi:tetratricopeptide (TPR) repeat protein